ncbi:MAG: hypothetical protein ACKOKE_04845 [Actinomycetota bacterium]
MEGRLVLVRSFGSVPEGFLARARLEAEGIPVLAKGGDGPYRMGPVHLFVPEDLEVQARLVLESPDVEVTDADLEAESAADDPAGDPAD